MKATLEFDTGEPDQLREFREASKASSMAIALWDLDQMLRNVIKYENMYHPGYLTEEEDKLAEWVRDKLHEIIDEYDVKFVLEG